MLPQKHKSFMKSRSSQKNDNVTFFLVSPNHTFAHMSIII